MTEIAEWDQLDLESVRAFLADAGDEGLTWEAKGGEEPHPGTVLKAGSGFANSVGGHLILGAERDSEGQWQAVGMSFRDEATTWLSSVITSGLQPIPSFDIRFVRDNRTGKLAEVDMNPELPPLDPGDPGRTYVFKKDEEVEADHEAVLDAPGAFVVVEG